MLRTVSAFLLVATVTARFEVAPEHGEREHFLEAVPLDPLAKNTNRASDTLKVRTKTAGEPPRRKLADAKVAAARQRTEDAFLNSLTVDPNHRRELQTTTCQDSPSGTGLKQGGNPVSCAKLLELVPTACGRRVNGVTTNVRVCSPLLSQVVAAPQLPSQSTTPLTTSTWCPQTKKLFVQWPLSVHFAAGAVVSLDSTT